MLNPNKRGVSPVIAIVLLLMMTVAAAGAAYFWITSMQSSVQQSAGSQIEAITKQASTRIIAQATLCKPPAEDDLVGYWKFDQGEGTTAEDSAGDNDGTINGASWVKYGERYALDFDGSDDYVDIPDIYAGHDKLTISAWVYPERFTGTNYYINSNDIIAKQGGAGTDEMFASILDGGNLSVSIRPDGTWYSAELPSFFPSKNKWYHLAISYDGSSVSVYRDGKLIDSGSASGTTVDNGNNLLIGSGGEADTRFQGKIDEVRIYDKALTGEKVKSERVDVTVYNAGAQEVPEGTWVANLVKNGNTIESDTYNASSLDSEERITLNFYFSKLHPGGEYKIELEGTQTSTTVSC